jgi:hypothetical protein
MGVTDMYAEQAVRDACIEFCERTEIIQGVDAYSTVSGTAEYDIQAPTQQRLVRVVRVTYNAVELAPVAIDEVKHGAAMRAGVDTTVASDSGTPYCFYQRTPSDTAIYLWPVPNTSVTGALGVRAAFAPTRTCNQVEDDLYDVWITEIVSGALAKLLITPGQPFTNSSLAEHHRKQFESGMAKAIGDAKRGATRGALRVQPRAFA